MSIPFIIHGHFYQPPRDNPWTGEVDGEPSAYPCHDWNERVHLECYRPNAFARIFDDYGKIRKIVDNYTKISFNFGPTLLSWLERRAPSTYSAILAADRESMLRNGGHGNAIAQGYNHAILPLCNARDRRTQVRWGLYDFRHRFGRAAESLWLPETACNDATIATLIDEGMRYVILSPHQADSIRPLDGEHFHHVADGSIDPAMAYRCYHPDGSGRYITAFFYDGHVARELAFGGAARSSQALVETVVRASCGGRLVHVATDGESYGHHTRHGERALAYALEVEAPSRGYFPTNYGAWLDEHPATYEVRLKSGPGGEGTAWSCAHGVGRWWRDCGCQTGAREGFRQGWRTPLRQALDMLRDHVAQAFEQTTGELFVDAWNARDAYIELLMNLPVSREDWFRRHGKGRLSEREKTRALVHLELQRNALLMYTSCGWFFSDISGIETVQILKYAGRAMDLMDDLGLDTPREAFREILGAARSNFPEMGTGADVFDRFVEPMRITGSRIAAHLVLTSLVDARDHQTEKAGYRIEWSHFRRQRHGRLTMASGRIQLEHIATGKQIDQAFVSMHFGGIDFYCVLRAFPGLARFQASTGRLWTNFRTASLPTMLRIAHEELGSDEHNLESVLPEERQKIAGLVFGDLVAHFTDMYVQLYEGNQRVLEMLQEAGLQLPPAISAAAELTLGARFDREMRAVRGSFEAKDYAKAIDVAQEVARHGYRIERRVHTTEWERMLETAMQTYRENQSAENAQTILHLLELAKRLHLEPNLEQVQDMFYEVHPTASDAPLETAPQRTLAAELGFARESGLVVASDVGDASNAMLTAN